MKTVRIASASGFWGDSLEAPIRQISDGPIDYLVMDYLAELTMSIMAGMQNKNPEHGYAKDFVDLIEKTASTLKEKKVKVIANAGGVNPRACAEKIKEVLVNKKINLKVAVVEGDDLRHELDSLISKGEEFKNLDTDDDFASIKDKIQSINAYIGADPIVDALMLGADIIITGRASDPSLALAPLIHEFKWSDHDQLALGTVAAHLIECGAQVTGGNCSYDWESIPDLANIGYPIIEATGDDKIIITKHKKTGGRVDLRSVKEQLVYEILDPANYITPDVVADFTTVKLKDLGENRVEISGVKGKAATDKYKVSASYQNGYKAEGTLIYTWPDAVKKSEAAARILKTRLENLGLVFDEVYFETIGEGKEVTFRAAVRGQNKEDVERFTREIAPLVLNGPPGATGYNKGKPRVQNVFSYWPALVSKNNVKTKISIL